MCKILLSIKPQYVERIRSFEKRYEYRRCVAKKKIESILIYETAPTKKIIGEVEVRRTLTKSLDDLWSETASFSGLDKKEFYDYFSGKETGSAYELGDVKIYKKERLLSDFGLEQAPQSFCYLD